jgi:thioredoxin-like negative regulator of GroEL
MKKFFLIFILLFVSVTSFAQIIEKQAIENPLDCAFYLLQKDNDRFFGDVERLAHSYFELKQYPQIISTLNLLENKSYRFENVVLLITQLLKDGRKVEAGNFIKFAFQNLDKKDYQNNRSLIEFADNLIALSRFSEAIKIAENFTTDKETEEISIAIALSLIKSNRIKETQFLISQPFFPINSKNNEVRAKIALIYAKLGQKDKTIFLLNELKINDFKGKNETETENNRRFILPILLEIYLHLNQPEQSFILWNQYGDKEYFYEVSEFVKKLIDYKQIKTAKELIEQMLRNKEELRIRGSYVISSLLKLGEIEKAVSVAKDMSKENDNYSQQESLMLIADNFIEQRNFQKAKEILDFALRKAKQVVFNHEPMQSNGASSGTRKRTYLRNIYNGFIKLREFEKAFQAINSIESNHWIAKGFIAEKYIDFAKHRYKTLSKNQIYQLISQSQNIIKDEDEVYSIEIKMLSAEVFALLGEKEKAVDLLSQVLEEAKESYADENKFLVYSGKIYEKYQLKPTPNLRRVLQNIISAKS